MTTTLKELTCQANLDLARTGLVVETFGNLSVIDRATGKIVRQIPIGKNPEFVRVRGDIAFVSFEPAAVGGPPPKPGSEEAKKLEEEREKENAEPAKIAVVDLKQGKVLRTITGGMETEGIEFSVSLSAQFTF